MRRRSVCFSARHVRQTLSGPVGPWRIVMRKFLTMTAVAALLALPTVSFAQSTGSGQGGGGGSTGSSAGGSQGSASQGGASTSGGGTAGTGNAGTQGSSSAGGTVGSESSGGASASGGGTAGTSQAGSGAAATGQDLSSAQKQLDCGENTSVADCGKTTTP